MIDKFKQLTGDLYSQINRMLNPFRNLPEKNEQNIVGLLEKLNI